MKRRFEFRAIYDYTKDHLSEWFPKLPSYQAFCYRLNRLAPAFQSLARIWMDRDRHDVCGGLLPHHLGKTENIFLCQNCPRQANYGQLLSIDELWQIALSRDYSVKIITPRKQKKKIFCAVETHSLHW